MRRWVALGSTSGHDYCFFLPIVCEAWRKMGYEPVVFLVGPWGGRDDQSPLHRLVWRALEDRNVQILNVPNYRGDELAGVEPATMAQSIRLHAAAHPVFGANDLLIPSDADLIPIRKEFYYQHDLNKADVASYYSNGYIGEPDHFPSCHISARVKHWREFMEYESNDPREAMMATLKKHGIEQKMADKQADQQKNWGHVWFLDEHSVSKQIINSRFYPGSFQRIEREGHPPKDRLDRACWPEKIVASNYSDCHSVRPGWSDANYPRLRPLLQQILPEHMDWIDEYRKKFREAMGCPG